MNTVQKTLLLATVALLALAVVPVAFAQDAAFMTVSGQVFNGTAGAEAPPNMQVLLNINRLGLEPELRVTTTDADGNFAFEDVPVGASRYEITTSYLGVSYNLDYGPDEDLSNIRVPVYEATSDMSNIAIASNSVLVLGADVRTRTLSFMEIVQVRNDGDRAFLPDQSQGMGFLRFPLPADAVNLDIQSELPEGKAIKVDQGFGIIAPVPPGEFGIAFTYAAPYEGGSFDLSRTFQLDVERLRVLVPQPVGSASSTNLEALGDTTIGNAVFSVFQTAGIAPGESVGVSIRDLPRPTLWQRARWAVDGEVRLLLIPAAMTLGLIVLLFLGMRRRASIEAFALVQAGADRGALVQAVARLDDQYANGDVGEGAYRSRRRMLKGQLLRLASQQVVE